MLTFASPLWLLGVPLLLPLIRWLHRGGRYRREVTVAHLALWQRAAASNPAAAERQPPDPAWRRRALLAALLLLALAEPRFATRQARITLWIDDSPSMQTQEAQGTRLAIGLARARALLADRPAAEVELRTLGDPWRRMTWPDESAAAAIAAEPGRPAVPPPAALLQPDRLHWLLTDGAHRELLAWPGGVRPDRVIQVGTVSRNVGIERLAARRRPDDPDRIELLVKVGNGGTADESRELVLTTDRGEVQRQALRIDPGKSLAAIATIAAADQVRARLEPGDALAADDQIVLDLAPLRRRRVAVDPGCPGPLADAVAAHPALVAVAPGVAGADAGLDCGSLNAAGRIPTVRVRADRIPVPIESSLLWLSSVTASQRIALDSQKLRVAARIEPRPGDTVWLAAGDDPVIVGRAGAAPGIETALDLGATRHDPQVPLLVDWMFERVLGVPLLDAIAVVDRGPGASRVVPAAPAAFAAPARPAGDAEVRRDRAWPLVIAALLVLLWEIAALGRQWRRLGVIAEGGSG